MDANEIRELFKTHGVKLGQKDIWDVKGKPVVHHAALERLAAALEITWDAPNIVTAKSDEVVIWCRATRKDKISEWSFGEAKIAQKGTVGGNYRVSGEQPAYPFAMAEKRAKDRVIIKLAGLYGAYSDEEAEDFSDARPKTDAAATKAETPKAEAKPAAKVEAKAEPETKSAAETGAKVAADAAPNTEEKANEAKPEPTDQERYDALLKSLKKHATSIGAIASWGADKRVVNNIAKLPPEMAKALREEGRKIQAGYQAAAAEKGQPPSAGSKRDGEGRMEDAQSVH